MLYVYLTELFRFPLHLRRTYSMEEIAEAWHVDFDVHVIRKDVYKGKVGTAGKTKLRFNAVTTPGYFLMASWPRINWRAVNLQS